MVICAARFNIYLCLLAAGVLVTGCHTAKHEKQKQLTLLRIHLEVTATPMDFSTSVPVYREKPVMINVDKEPFLTEADVASAKVVEDRGGFALQIEFDHSGTMLLEEYTTANTGRRMAVFAQFGKTKEESRWLAAPLIARRITNGRLIFTPDATREEVERIALGLNNLQEDKQKGGK
jgi:preprotein translocase subunit SecD